MSKFFVPIEVAEDGTFKNRAAVKAVFDSLPRGKTVMMELRELDRHSRLSDGYYFGCVCKYALRGFRALGYDHITDECDAHQELKKNLLKGKSTANMNDTEFSFYVDRVCKYIAEHLHEVVPPPDKFYKK